MFNNGNDNIDNNEGINIKNRVAITRITFYLLLSNTLDWLHGTVLSHTLRITLDKLLGIKIGITFGNKIGITLQDIVEIISCIALEVEHKSNRDVNF